MARRGVDVIEAPSRKPWNPGWRLVVALHNKVYCFTRKPPGRPVAGRCCSVVAAWVAAGLLHLDCGTVGHWCYSLLQAMSTIVPGSAGAATIRPTLDAGAAGAGSPVAGRALQWFAQLAGDWNPRDLRDGGGFAELLAALLLAGGRPGRHLVQPQAPGGGVRAGLPPPGPGRPAGAAHPPAPARQGRGPAAPPPAPQQHRAGTGGARPVQPVLPALLPQRRHPGRRPGREAARGEAQPPLDHLLPVHPQRPGGDLGVLQDAGRAQAVVQPGPHHRGVPGLHPGALAGRARR